MDQYQTPHPNQGQTPYQNQNPYQPPQPYPPYRGQYTAPPNGVPNGYSPQPVYYQPVVVAPPMISEEARQQLELRNKKRLEKNQLIKDGVLFGATILASLLIQAVFVMGLYKSPHYALFESSCIFQNSFNVLAVHIASMLVPFALLALILKKRFTGPLIPAKKVDKLPLAAWVSVGMGLCLVSNLITNGVIEAFKFFGYELTQTQYEKPDTAFAVVVVIVATAIIPAVIEEFAFRCSVMGILRGRGKFFAVLASSIVFGLMHGNVIQFVFAFFVGLTLGYITLVTDSVIPAMLVHGFNNGLSVFDDVCNQFIGGKTADYLIAALVILWSVLALLGLVYLIRKKALILKKAPEEKEKSLLSFGGKLLCLLPGLIIPLIILIAVTAQTVVPIK